MKDYQLSFLAMIRHNAFLRNFIFSEDVLDFIACQFALESNFGASSLAITCCNYCGMKEPYRRVHYAIAFNSDGFCIYSSLDTCIIDYISWLLYNRPTNVQLSKLDSFIIFLRNSGYCPEKDYIAKIQSIYSQFKSSKNGN